MPTKYCLIIPGKTIGDQWLYNWIQWHDFNFHSKVYFSLFELESLLLNCPLWNCEAGPRPRSWPGVVTNLRNLTDVSWQLLVLLTRSTPYWSYLFTLLSTLTLWKIHAGLNRPEAPVSEAGNIKAGWRTTDGEEAVKAPVVPPTISSDHTNLSKPPLGLGDVGFLIHHHS